MTSSGEDGASGSCRERGVASVCSREGGVALAFEGGICCSVGSIKRGSGLYDSFREVGVASVTEFCDCVLGKKAWPL